MAKKENTGLIVISPELQKSIDAINYYKASVESISANCKLISIKDETTLAIAQQNLSKANTLLTDLENKIKAIRKPYNDQLKKIGEVGSGLTSPLEEAVKHLKSEVLRWEEKRVEEAKKVEPIISAVNNRDQLTADKERKRSIVASIYKIKIALDMAYEVCITPDTCDEKMQSIEEKYKPDEFWGEYLFEATNLKRLYLELIRQRKLELMAANLGNENQVAFFVRQEESLKEGIKEVIYQLETRSNKELEDLDYLINITPALGIPVIAAPKTRNIRYSWDFEVTDMNLVPRGWLQIDESAVKEYIKENKDILTDGVIINGVKFVKKATVVA